MLPGRGPPGPLLEVRPAVYDFLRSGFSSVPYRTTAKPFGLRPREPKTLQGTRLAMACLMLLSMVHKKGDMGDLEQLFLSRMRWLPAYKALLAREGVELQKVASCAYGAPWQKLSLIHI